MLRRVIRLVCLAGGFTMSEIGSQRPEPERLPGYREIIDDLTRQIKRKVLKPGELRPSRADLAEHYGVHRSTIDRVMSVLADRKLVEGHQGRGTFVRAPDPD